ncbi:MAG TPA: alpha/beta fold hydrolase [Solirubrobacteraceae bacterium]|nr:alpha/beta fold hydrolase [Solirubrobacteraceae bacterium]
MSGEELPLLVCLPHAGGAAAAFRTWPAALDGIARVVAFEPPGRGTRRGEPLPRTMEELAGDYAAQLDALDTDEYVLLGHSLGSLAARVIAGEREPRLLIAAGRNGPTCASETAPVAHLPDAELLDAVTHLGGVPAVVRQEPDLLRLFAEPLRADLNIAETWLRPKDMPPLTCPIAALQGTRDPVVSRANAGAWANETTASTTVAWLDGDHFFLHRPGVARRAVAPLIAQSCTPTSSSDGAVR